jgi:hypothetical protein
MRSSTQRALRFFPVKRLAYSIFKITAMLPNEDKNIFTDEIDYAKTSDQSVWGTED